MQGFVREYAPRNKIESLGERSLAISFKKYRWGLNDQSPIGEEYSGFRLATRLAQKLVPLEARNSANSIDTRRPIR